MKQKSTVRRAVEKMLEVQEKMRKLRQELEKAQEQERKKGR